MKLSFIEPTNHQITEPAHSTAREFLSTVSLLETAYKGKDAKTNSIVIKIGGSVLTSKETLDSLAEQISHLSALGHQIVLVHGAGPQINEYLNAQGIPVAFEKGLRVTDDAALMGVYAALALVNATIVSALKNKGLPAVGLHAEPNLFSCSKKLLECEDGANIDLGWVGNIDSTHEDTLAKYQDQIMVVSPMGWDQHRNKYNINADHAAFAIAVALQSQSLVFVSDVPGVLEEPANKSSLLPTLHKHEIATLIEKGCITGGMIPKLNSCLEALEQGVAEVRIISAHEESSLIASIAGGKSVGTTIYAVEQPSSLKVTLKQIA